MSYTFDQQMIQRFAAAKNKKTAQVALMLNIPGVILLVSFCCFSGLVLYANFYDCDPLSDKDNSGVDNPNQLLTHFVLKKFNDIPCILGLFMSSIFCASLSSLSSALNSLSACLWRDFFIRLNLLKKYENQSLIVTKILVVFCGIVCTCMGFLISNLGSNLIQISSTINGALQGI